MRISSGKMPEAELQRRMGIYFPDPSGKHTQTHMHRALQEASHSTNICQTRREVGLILKKKLKNQDIDDFFEERT